MKTTFHLELMLALIVVAVLAQAWPVQAGAFEDAEDSPLYAASRNNAFANMLVHDRTPTSQPASPIAALAAGPIVAVEGTKWQLLPAPPPLRAPAPRDVTTSYTCPGNGTCYGSTVCGSPTCFPSSTCSGQTCSGWPTCYPSPTCPGVGTCGGFPTCSGYPTCSGASTCASTCSTTCSVANCPPPTITGVNITQPGQFQLSFFAQGVTNVSYNVLFCTNLDVAQWTTVFSIPANNSTVTFTHTNNAPRAYYRLSMQNR